MTTQRDIGFAMIQVCDTALGDSPLPVKCLEIQAEGKTNGIVMGVNLQRLTAEQLELFRRFANTFGEPVNW